MKQSLISYWNMLKAAFGFVIMTWAMGVFTILILCLTSVNVLANADYWAVIGSIITVPVHHWFKNRK